MSSHHLILTVDYELFGDGSGSIDACVIDSTERILSTAEKHNACVTLFVDAVEFSVMLNSIDNKGKQWRLAASRVIAQIEEAVRRGHDVQLHLHPQWVGASLQPSGEWLVDFDSQRIGDMDYAEIFELIANGKYFLESIVKLVKSDYECIAFRAGGWGIQPSELTLKALAGNGIKIDSTVAPGKYNSADRIAFDFRSTPAMPYWYVDNNICVSSPIENNLVEVPIATSKFSYLASLYKLLRRKFVKKSVFPCGCDGNYGVGLTKKELCKLLFSKLVTVNVEMLDFSTCDSNNLLEITKRNKSKNTTNNPVPLVAISHSKNFTDASILHMDEYLRVCSVDEDIIFSTYPMWLDSVEK